VRLISVGMQKMITTDSEGSEPRLLKLGKIFEERFRIQFLGTGGSEEGVGVMPQCHVIRSRGTERSQMLDAAGDPTNDPELHVSLQTLRPIVIRGFGRVDLMVFYIDDDGMRCHVVIEIKNTEWDDILAGRVVKMLGDHRRQVYGYLEPLEYRARRGELGRPQGIVVYPHRPHDSEVQEIVPNYFAEYGIETDYKDELLREAPDDPVPLRLDTEFGRQPWLTMPPACELCSAGQVLIRQLPRPSGLTNDLARTHALTCPGSP
jgi:hypothetical protein